jgi:hypothetical protein
VCTSLRSLTCTCLVRFTSTSGRTWTPASVCIDVNLGLTKQSECEMFTINKGKAVPLHAMDALGGRGDIAPTRS